MVEFWEGPPAELRIEGGRFEGTREARATVLAYGSNRSFKRGMRARKQEGGTSGLFDPNWRLPNPEKWLNTLDPGLFPPIARALGEMLSLPDGAYLEHRGKAVVIVDTVHKTETPLTQHSDGYRSIFATAVDMLSGLLDRGDVMAREGVVLIDEIETHLHPRWKMRLMSALRKTLPKVQFIVTTHDPLCLRAMGAGEVEVMARGEDNRIGLVPGLPDPSSLRIDQILTSEHFGMRSTLDPDFEALFDRYYQLLRRIQTDPSLGPEIEQLRNQINARQRIGQTEREQLLLEAIDRHLATRAPTGPERITQKEALDDELASIWTEAKAGLA